MIRKQILALYFSLQSLSADFEEQVHRSQFPLVIRLIAKHSHLSYLLFVPLQHSEPSLIETHLS